MNRQKIQELEKRKTKIGLVGIGTKYHDKGQEANK
jgi:hypothetical protein